MLPPLRLLRLGALNLQRPIFPLCPRPAHRSLLFGILADHAILMTAYWLRQLDTAKAHRTALGNRALADGGMNGLRFRQCLASRRKEDHGTAGRAERREGKLDMVHRLRDPQRLHYLGADAVGDGLSWTGVARIGASPRPLRPRRNSAPRLKQELQMRPETMRVFPYPHRARSVGHFTSPTAVRMLARHSGRRLRSPFLATRPAPRYRSASPS